MKKHSTVSEIYDDGILLSYEQIQEKKSGFRRE